MIINKLGKIIIKENYGGKTEVRSSHFGVFSILQLFLLANSSIYLWVLTARVIYTVLVAMSALVPHFPSQYS